MRPIVRTKTTTKNKEMNTSKFSQGSSDVKYYY